MNTRISLFLLGTLSAGVMGIGVALDRASDPRVEAKTKAIAAPQAARTAILNVRLFDGEHGVARTTVVFEGDHIVAVGPDVKAPADAQIVDGAGKTLLPGLIDAHTHAYGDALERALVFGVTTELDMFTDAAAAQSARMEQATRRVTTRADLRSAGVLVTAPGGHGTEFGMSIPTLGGAEEAQTFVDARIAE